MVQVGHVIPSAGAQRLVQRAAILLLCGCLIGGLIDAVSTRDRPDAHPCLHCSTPPYRPAFPAQCHRGGSIEPARFGVGQGQLPVTVISLIFDWNCLSAVGAIPVTNTSRYLDFGAAVNGMVSGWSVTVPEPSTVVCSNGTVGPVEERTSIFVPGVALVTCTAVGVVSFCSSSVSPTPVFRLGNCCLYTQVSQAESAFPS